MRRKFLLFAFIVSLFVFNVQAQNTSPYWSLAGNSNAATTSKLGTTNLIPLRLFTNNTARIYIDTNGKVGIGAIIPQQQLHVEGLANEAIFVSTTALSNISGSGMIGYAKAFPTAAGQRLGYFLVGSRGGGQSTFNVAGMAGYTAGAWGSGSHPAYLTFETTPAGSATRVERLRIDQNGYVGIGTTAPAYALDVESSSSTAVYGNSHNGYGFYGHSTIGYGGIASSDSSDGFDAYSTKGYYGVYASCGNGTAVYADGSLYGTHGSGSTCGAFGYSSGGYGVFGTTSGGYAGGYFKSVNEYGLAAETTNAAYAAAFFGSVYTSGSYAASDRTLKKNIQDFGDAMGIINKLQPKYYEFKTEAKYTRLHLPSGKHYGLLAQDLEQMLPSLVKESTLKMPVDDNTQVLKPKTANGKDENVHPKGISTIKVDSFTIKAVNYTELIPIMIKGMQELSKENEELKKKANKVDELEARLQNLEALLVKGNTGLSVSAAYLETPVPNPSNSTTTLRYDLPDGTTSARLTLINARGQVLKEMNLTNKGAGQVNLNTASLPAGIYTYTLVIDGRQAGSKQLVIAR